MDPTTLAVVIVLTVLLALAALVQALRLERRWRLVRDLPVSRAGGVFVGLVEVVAAIRSGTPLTSHLAGQACAWYRWSIEESWSRQVTETTTDSKGRTSTSTRTESGWSTIASGGEQAPFELVDDSGSVRVVPDGASVDAEVAVAVDCGRSSPWYYGKGPQQAIANSDHQRRFSESLLPLAATCSVIGHARQQPGLDALEIARDAGSPIFAISLKGAPSIARGYFWSGLALKLAGLAVAVLGARYAGGLQDPDWTVPLLAGAGYLLACLGGWALLVHNSLVELRARVRQAWANIDVQLKRRYDLIQALVPLIAGITGHEARTQTTLATLRSQLQATPPGQPGGDPVAVAPQLLAVAEAYPTLVSQGQFSHLQQSLTDCEGRIALARTYFNDIATSWNTRLERVPDVLVARLSAMRPQPLLQGFSGVEAPAPLVKI
jgi:hypothetical protein